MNTIPAVKTPARYLNDYKTGACIRVATKAESRASDAAAKTDGGIGVIVVDGLSCYVV